MRGGAASAAPAREVIHLSLTAMGGEARLDAIAAIDYVAVGERHMVEQPSAPKVRIGRTISACTKFAISRAVAPASNVRTPAAGNRPALRERSVRAERRRRLVHAQVSQGSDGSGRPLLHRAEVGLGMHYGLTPWASIIEVVTHFAPR